MQDKLVVSHKYEFLEDVELSSITISDSAYVGEAVLNAQNYWYNYLTISGFNSLGFGVNSSLNIGENTLYITQSYMIDSDIEGEIEIKFTFADGKEETDTIKYLFKAIEEDYSDID